MSFKSNFDNIFSKEAITIYTEFKLLAESLKSEGNRVSEKVFQQKILSLKNRLVKELDSDFPNKEKLALELLLWYQAGVFALTLDKGDYSHKIDYQFSIDSDLIYQADPSLFNRFNISSQSALETIQKDHKEKVIFENNLKQLFSKPENEENKERSLKTYFKKKHERQKQVQKITALNYRTIDSTKIKDVYFELLQLLQEAKDSLDFLYQKHRHHANLIHRGKAEATQKNCEELVTLIKDEIEINNVIYDYFKDIHIRKEVAFLGELELLPEDGAPKDAILDHTENEQ